MNSITSENLSSILRDSGEVVLDNVLNEGVLHDIPFLNIGVSAYKFKVEMDYRSFIKKVTSFLKELPNVSHEERQNYVESIEQNPKEKNILGEILLLLIDRADSLEKPSILGRLLKHHILENISYDDAIRLSFIVDRVYMSDLNYLTKFKSGIQSNPNIAASLQSAGLLNLAGMDGGNLDEPSSGGVFYELNDYGKMLLQYGLDSAV